MTRKMTVALVAAALACGAALTAAFRPAAAQGGDSKAARAAWDYKVIQGPQNEKALKELGNEGWELVAVTGGQPYIASSTTIINPATKNTTTNNTVQYAPLVHCLKRKR